MKHVKGIALLAWLILLLASAAQGATLSVAYSGAPYTNVQDAVDHATAGDVVQIGPGIFPGPVTVSSAVVLRGSGAGETILSGGAAGSGLVLSAANVRIEGFTVKGEGNGTGIHVAADTVDLKTIEVIGWGIGLFIENSQGTRVSECDIHDNSEFGVILQASTGSVLSRSSVRNNGAAGLSIDPASTGNTFYLNNFQNSQNALVESGGNAWNSPGTLSYSYDGLERQSVMGNYWSDHTGTDANTDGIVDSPYVIEPKKGKGSIKNPRSTETDLYPLVIRWEGFFPNLPPTTTGPVTTIPTPAPTEIPTSPSTEIPTSSPPTVTTTAPGNAEEIPSNGGYGLLPFLVVGLLLLGTAGGGWLILRQLSSAKEGKREDPGAVAHTSVRNSDTLLVPGSTLSQGKPSIVGAAPFPSELNDRYSSVVYAGKGGIARVFKAVRRSDGRTVAVKIPVSFDEETGKAFMKEMRVWEDLHHPNIAEVTAVNILPLPFVEMEYLSHSLDVCTKPLKCADAVRIIRGIATGLSYAHQKGVIHRDLKPHNILLTSDLTPKITDWGLSRLLSDDANTRMEGFSLPYASPEQLSPARFGPTGPWTDIYQLGAILYELVVGRPPFEGNGLYETGSAIVSIPAAPPLEVDTEVTSILPVIIRCLEKEPSHRYGSVEEFLGDLDRRFGSHRA